MYVMTPAMNVKGIMTLRGPKEEHENISQYFDALLNWKHTYTIR